MSIMVADPIPAEAPNETRPSGARSGARYQCIETGPGLMSWRLVVGNGRCLGRAAQALPDCRAVLEHISYVQRVARQAELSVTRGSDGAGWRLTVDGYALAESSHPYGRPVEAQRAAERFLEECVGALVDPTVAVSRNRPSQSRRPPQSTIRPGVR